MYVYIFHTHHILQWGYGIISIESPLCGLQMSILPDNTPAICTGDREIASLHQVRSVDADLVKLFPP